MEDKIIDTIYDSIQDKNFYNYDNDDELDDVCINEYMNISNKLAIDICIGNDTYTITCNKTYSGCEEQNENNK